MRASPLTAPLVVLFALFIALVAAGTPAQAGTLAGPVADPEAGSARLTDNALYRAGPVDRRGCAFDGGGLEGAAGAERRLGGVLRCLDDVWRSELGSVGVPFRAPETRFITRPVRDCGESWSDEAQAQYCDAERQITVMLDKAVVKDPQDKFLTLVLAHEYGHHVQLLTGISAAFDRLPLGDETEVFQQERRYELQAECLGGVFLGAVWDGLGQGPDGWRRLLDVERTTGDESATVPDHGKGDTIVRWLERGFTARSAAACDTWSAASAEVA
jgi:predicted metalloprotease